MKLFILSFDCINLRRIAGLNIEVDLLIAIVMVVLSTISMEIINCLDPFLKENTLPKP